MSSKAAERVIQQGIVDLCWGAWSELGVSGWARTHQGWAIDPEPLIVFTTAIADREPRLRDEALDWCIRNSRYVSQIRLRNIVSRQSEDTMRPWGRFAATVNARAGTRWAGASTEWRYKITGRSILRPLIEPSMVLVRMRATFGLGACSEILRYLLFGPENHATSAMLATATNYAKRNVADACEALVQAGLLTTRTTGNRFYYAMANPHALAEFLGALPAVVPDWNPLLRTLGVLLTYADRSIQMSHELRTVLSHQAALEIETELATLGIQPPGRIPGQEFLEVWDQWIVELMEQLAHGTWPGNASHSTALLLRSSSN